MEDEELFKIPHRLVLSVANSKLSEQMSIPKEDLGPWLSLMLVMVYEYLQGRASPWASYFRILPTEFDTLMFWTDEELSELQGSAIIQKIGKGDAEETILNQLLPLVSKHSHLFPHPSSVKSFDSNEGRKAFLEIAHRMGSLIMAYAFDLEDGEDGSEGESDYVTDEEEPTQSKGMVPLADLLNADGERNNVSLIVQIPLFFF